MSTSPQATDFVQSASGEHHLENQRPLCRWPFEDLEALLKALFVVVKPLDQPATVGLRTGVARIHPGWDDRMVEYEGYDLHLAAAGAHEWVDLVDTIDQLMAAPATSSELLGETVVP